MASNDRNSKASRCLKSIEIPSNSALRPHVPRRKFAGPSTRRSLLVKETFARGCRSSYGQIRQNSENRPQPAPLLRGQRGPNALRPLPQAWIAGRIRRGGKRLQAHPREPVQKVGIRWSKAGADALLAPYAASRTCVDPTSSIGELVRPQPPDKKMGCTRVLAVSLQRSERHASC